MAIDLRIQWDCSLLAANSLVAICMAEALALFAVVAAAEFVVVADASVVDAVNAVAACDDAALIEVLVDFGDVIEFDLADNSRIAFDSLERSCFAEVVAAVTLLVAAEAEVAFVRSHSNYLCTFVAIPVAISIDYYPLHCLNDVYFAAVHFVLVAFGIDPFVVDEDEDEDEDVDVDVDVVVDVVVVDAVADAVVDVDEGVDVAAYGLALEMSYQILRHQMMVYGMPEKIRNCLVSTWLELFLYLN